MKRYIIFHLSTIGLTVLLLSACNIAHLYHRPELNLNGLYRDQAGTDTISIASLHWKQVFTDTLLQKAIAEGIHQNLDLKVAYSHIREAQAYFDQSRLAFFPVLGADGSATISGYSNPVALGKSANTHQSQSGLTASWEADIWGKLRSAKKANLAALLQTEANAKAVQTELVASIATSYYHLLALDEQLQITRQSVKNWQATVDIMKQLKNGDVVTGAAIVQSESNKYAVSATIPDLLQAIRETENGLNLLLGRAPGAVERSRFDVLDPLSLLQTGVPAQLLANRPDVQAAEYNFKYAFELTNVARSYFYPSLRLSASGGYSALNGFFSPGSWISSLTAGLTQSIFNQGANKTRLKIALEQQQQAVLNFQNSLLIAGQEVSNAMYSYQSALDKKLSRDNQLLNLQKSVEYTQALVKYGSANYTEVLTAQQGFLTAQLNQVNDRLQQLDAVVLVYRSLGGGWE